MKNIGLYLHIPFCKSKCPYCDFYSFLTNEDDKIAYVNALKNTISLSYNTLNSADICKADTLYIGGGTPSVLLSEQLSELISLAKSTFLTDDAEITVECNPYGLTEEYVKRLAFTGVNRISMGLQSAVDTERRQLGRLSTQKTVENAVNFTKRAGIENISLDVMLGIPDQTEKSLNETISFCLNQDISHISGYILKLEENTIFYKNRSKYNFPDDDLTADLYLQLCESLEAKGIYQYEISNFSKAGFESRHNLKYWHCEEYLGIGPSAHSFLNGKRFYFPRNIKGFISSPAITEDGLGGDFCEYAMLALRLTEGLSDDKVRERFGHPIPSQLKKKSQIFIKNGLMEQAGDSLHLTRQGFLLSNSILAEIL